MNEFNHLKNVCEFLDNASSFEHTMYEANHELDERLRDDTMFQYNEAESREMFADHLYDIMTSMTGVDDELANRIVDVIAPAFYCVNDAHYRESTMLQNMLRAADAAAKKQCEQMAAGDYNFKKFKIIIDDYSAEFLLGGPQLAALDKFADHIAFENGYQITRTEDDVVVEE